MLSIFDKLADLNVNTKVSTNRSSSPVQKAKSKSGDITQTQIINEKPPKRSIDDGKANKDIAKLLSHYPKEDYYIASILGDNEAELLAKDIDNLLTQCGWNRTAPRTFMVPIKDGVNIHVTNERKSTPSINVLANALYKNYGVQVNGAIDAMAENKIVILVGSNPQRFS